jgi:16S rRNA (cytidine1402-2'-O)-methyltransferase
MLYFVSTPIGNLGDLTYRAVEVLRQVDTIACEDRQKSLRLLNHFDIHKPLLSFHAHNETQAVRQIIGLLSQGKQVAVISEAGTPGISDPAYSLVQALVQAALPFTLIPGASALVNALVLSGLPSHSFTFRGFAPRKSGKRQRFLALDRESPHTLIFYESPYRVLDFLQDALLVYGDRPAAVANELTKLFENIQRGTLSSLLEKFRDIKVQGEYVVVIGGNGAANPVSALEPEEDTDALP